ncbi:hypothetical protein NOF04DRAFT_1271576 [Fusarium oxysporum II5]|nr:hypothetical protein NOF04DRAFT_1271576 [Fusarium oxysporum II5]
MEINCRGNENDLMPKQGKEAKCSYRAWSGLRKSLLEEARSFWQSFALDLGDGGFRVGALEGFVGPYALAGLHIAHGVSSLRGIDELPRVDSNAYTGADGIPLPSVMCAVVPLQEQLDGAFVSHGREVSRSAISLSDHLSEGIPVDGALIVAVGDLVLILVRLTLGKCEDAACSRSNYSGDPNEWKPTPLGSLSVLPMLELRKRVKFLW